MITLRPYQQELIDKVKIKWKDVGKKALLQLPTGGGKTVIFSFVSQQSSIKNNRKTFWVYERLDEDRKKVIDRFFTLEFEHKMYNSSYMVLNYLAKFLALLNDGCIPFYRYEYSDDEYTLCKTVNPLNLEAGEIVFVKPKKFLQLIPNKSEKDEHGYPLDKDHICFPTGHAMSVLFEWDNGRSKTVQRRCTRCGHEELDQYDYN